MSYDTKLMVKIANLYYKDNLKQESIAMDESDNIICYIFSNSVAVPPVV